MATVYKIEIKTVSPWVNYSEEDIKKMFKKFLDESRNDKVMGFESTEINVEKI